MPVRRVPELLLAPHLHGEGDQDLGQLRKGVEALRDNLLHQLGRQGKNEKVSDHFHEAGVIALFPSP